MAAGPSRLVRRVKSFTSAKRWAMGYSWASARIGTGPGRDPVEPPRLPLGVGGPGAGGGHERPARRGEHPLQRLVGDEAGRGEAVDLPRLLAPQPDRGGRLARLPGAQRPERLVERAGPVAGHGVRRAPAGCGRPPRPSPTRRRRACASAPGPASRSPEIGRRRALPGLLAATPAAVSISRSLQSATAASARREPSSSSARAAATCRWRRRARPPRRCGPQSPRRGGRRPGAPDRRGSSRRRRAPRVRRPAWTAFTAASIRRSIGSSSRRPASRAKRASPVRAETQSAGERGGAELAGRAEGGAGPRAAPPPPPGGRRRARGSRGTGVSSRRGEASISAAAARSAAIQSAVSDLPFPPGPIQAVTSPPCRAGWAERARRAAPRRSGPPVAGESWSTTAGSEA